MTYVVNDLSLKKVEYLGDMTWRVNDFCMVYDGDKVHHVTTGVIELRAINTSRGIDYRFNRTGHLKVDEMIHASENIDAAVLKYIVKLIDAHNRPRRRYRVSADDVRDTADEILRRDYERDCRNWEPWGWY